MKLTRKRPGPKEVQYEPGPVLKTLLKETVISAATEFRILITGSRDWTDIDTINKQLCKLIVEAKVPYKDVLVIAGGATGADTLARILCNEELGIAFAEFPAPWDFFNKQGNKRAAGPVRNNWMLRWGRPHYALAFHPYLPGSRGTKHMVELCHKAKVPVRIISKEIKP